MEPVTEIGIFESKTHFSEIIRRVMAGERFVITRHGKQVAELRPVEPNKRPLRFGSSRRPGYRMAPDFDEPLEDFGEYM